MDKYRYSKAIARCDALAERMRDAKRIAEVLEADASWLAFERGIFPQAHWRRLPGCGLVKRD